MFHTLRKLRNRPGFTLLIFAIFGMIWACKKDTEPVEPATDPALKFVEILNDSLKNKGFGYSFVVYKKNQLLGSGYGGLQARRVEVNADKPLTLDSKMQIASMTKTLTAVAFLKLAKEKGIRTTDKIISYLPPSWPKGENIDKITFRDLLTHRSGIIGLDEDCRNGAYLENYWYGLKALVEKGVKAGKRNVYCYQNANFGLFRILIPAINGYKFLGNDENDNALTSRMYERYVRENIMEKAGVASTEVLINSLPTPTLGYNHPYSGEYGFNPGDFKDVVGGYGFYLSANEAGKIYSRLFSNGDTTIISEALKDSVITSGLASYSALTPEGKFSYHDGWWYDNLSTGNPKGFRSLWMKCPDDIVVVLFTNALRQGDGLFPIQSNAYQDITSYALWAFYAYKEDLRNGRALSDNFHKYLKNPEPH